VVVGFIPTRCKLCRDESRPTQTSGRGSIQHAALCGDERLLRRLDMSVSDEVSIGARRFTVAARIVKDIDQSIGFASFAPRVLMNDADLASTGLLRRQRISYRLMIAAMHCK